MQRRENGVEQCLGRPVTGKIRKSRVLLVGAGGIGCELLKNLVCCGFGCGTQITNAQNGLEQASEDGGAPGREAGIVVIDLDTIDLSNLNRQFLFRKQHIKKPKALVAKETASQFNPRVNIDAHHASIFDPQYDVKFFESFDVIFNALDNLAARRHVNRMCLAADVPLIESGTTGFHGQVQAIKKGETECYDCNVKPEQKSFPICTIRSTPSQPIHCIVWAKSYLLPELFGTSEEDSADVTVTEGDNAEEVAKLKEEASALKKIRSTMGKPDFAQVVFNKVFYDDIERLRSMKEMWKTRSPPESLKFEKLSIDKDPVEQGRILSILDQNTWSVHDNLKVFCYSISTLSKRLQAGESVIEFDKDDKDTLDFVASAANLRSHIFSIPLSTEWNIKQMAGNIIPAIATSNALTASLCVMQAFKILRNQFQQTSGLAPAPRFSNGQPGGLLGGSKMVFLQSKSTDRLINSQSLMKPKADCPVCSPVYAKLSIPQPSSTKLDQLVGLLKSQFGYEEFSITVGEGIVYDPDLEDNLDKSLEEVGINGKDTGFVTVTDDADEQKVDLMLSVTLKAADGDGMQILSQVLQLPLKPKKSSQVNGEGVQALDAPTELPDSKKKRKREAEEENQSAQMKKLKVEDEIQVVEDDGAIVLD